MRKTAGSSVGRPQDQRVTNALLAATLIELADHGHDQTTVAAVAARARTSKQAVYRRYPNKTALFAAAIDRALQAASPAPPQRGSVSEDLRQCLEKTVSALQDTPLGGAIRALVPFRRHRELAAVLDEAESAHRLALRQIFVATPFEADMEIRIDLLLGMIFFRLMLRSITIKEQDIETAIYLVLGLVAPRDPDIFAGLPGT